MAESRSVVVKLSANVSGYERSMQQAGKTGSKAMGQVESSSKKADAAMDGLASKAGKVGLAAGTLLAGIGKSAMDWETAWAGVTKTTDGTAAQMAELEEGLRGLATTLPATHQEIAGVAEAAGQLGVAREDIVDFTRVMVDLGETTNLTAEDAATAIAQISNVMGTAGDDVGRFGAALVALGNDGASTESEILQMAQRIAGAGAQIGLAETDILAISNAAASMGINAEAGGSAISRVFTELAKATKQGGKDLESFSQVAGMSADEFTRAFEDDPARAFAAFTQGLDRINKSGGDVFTTLKDLGMSDVRVSQALLSMAASGDLLTDSLDLGAKAWEENTALADEAAKRYDTTAAQVRVAWNKIKDAGIEAGAVLLPVLAKAAEFVGSLADAFGSLPDPVQDAATGLLAITAVLGGGLWFSSKVVGAIRSTRAELTALSRTATTTATGMEAVAATGSRLNKFRAAAGAAGIGLGVLTAQADSSNKAVSVLGSTASGALLGFSVGGPIGAAIGGGAGALLGLATAADGAGESLGNARPPASDFASTLNELTGAATAATREMVFLDLQQRGIIDKGAEIGVSGREMVDAILGVDKAGGRLTQALDGSIKATDGLGDAGVGLAGDLRMVALAFDYQRGSLLAATGATASYKELIQAGFPKEVVTDIKAEGMPTTMADMERLVETYELTPDEIETIVALSGADINDSKMRDLLELGEEYEGSNPKTKVDADTGDTEKKLKAVSEAAETVAESFSRMNSVLSGRANWRDYEAALDAVTESVKANGRTLDTATAKGRANQEALDQVAVSAQKIAENLKGANRVRFLNRAREDLIDSAKQMGKTQKQAEALADYLGLIERSNPKVKVSADTDEANAKVSRLQEKLDRYGLTRANAEAAVHDVASGKIKTIQGLINKYGITRAQAQTLLRDNDVPGKLARINAELDRADRDVTSTITINTHRVNTVMERHLKSPVTNALGGFHPSVRRYAAGGMDRANAHQAEIARGAAPFRVWAEPETQGESYIPHANDHRRPRAESILAQTANLFGGKFVKYAEGDVVMARSIASSTHRSQSVQSAPVVTVGGARVRVFIDGNEVRAVVRQEMDAQDRWEGGLDR